MWRPHSHDTFCLNISISWWRVSFRGFLSTFSTVLALTLPAGNQCGESSGYQVYPFHICMWISMDPMQTLWAGLKLDPTSPDFNVNMDPACYKSQNASVSPSPVCRVTQGNCHRKGLRESGPLQGLYASDSLFRQKIQGSTNWLTLETGQWIMTFDWNDCPEFLISHSWFIFMANLP